MSLESYRANLKTKGISALDEYRRLAKLLSAVDEDSPECIALLDEIEFAWYSLSRAEAAQLGKEPPCQP